MSWNQKKLYYEIALPYTQVLEDLEWYGMRIDLSYLHRLKEELENKQHELETEIYKHVGRINIKSSEQKADAIFGKLRIPKFVMDYKYEKFTWKEEKDYFLTNGGSEAVKNGSNPEYLPYKFYSLDKVNLYKLRETTNHPIAQLMIDYSQVSKLLSTYINSLLEGNSKGDQILFGDRIHPSYFAYTKGGRLAAELVLTIPSRGDYGKKIKRLFVPDTDEYGFVRLDYSAIELRFLAWLAQEKTMLNGFASGVDLHALTTSYIKEFGLNYEESCLPENSEKRYYGKTTNFTLTYLGTYFSLQETFLKKGIYIDKKRCYDFQEAYFNLYKDIRPFHNRMANTLSEKGYIDNLFGRRRKFEGVKGVRGDDRKKYQFHSALKSATSHLVSGSSTGDYVPLKILGANELIKKEKFDARLWCNVHDGLIYQVNKKQIKEFAGIMDKYLRTPENPVTIDLPLETKINEESWQGL
jgi:DNA polymerase-1